VRRAALAELDALAHAYREQRDLAGLAQGLSSLLRRVALARFPREQVAALHGERWRELLARSRREGLPQDVAEALEAALYRPREQDAAPSGSEDAGLRWLGAVRRFVGATR
jgi:uncharacterized protein with von Willebrand factor type A (vWA) domain